MIPWNDSNTFQFSTPPKMPRNQRKQTTGKIRTRWLGRNRFNPIKMRSPNTPDTKVPELDNVDIKTPISTKMCDRFGLLCSYCKQSAPHPSPQESDWSSEDWDITEAKAREQTDTLIDFYEPRPQTESDKTTDIDEVAFSKLQIRQSNLKEELIEVTDSLIPPPLVMETSGDMTGNANIEELSGAEKRHQQEEEKYDLYRKVYVGQLSNEESDMDSDGLTYSYLHGDMTTYEL